MTRPNGIATNYSYDKLSHLLSALHQAGTSTIDGASYTLDAAGIRYQVGYQQITENGNAERVPWIG